MRKYLAGLALITLLGCASAFPASIHVVDRTATSGDDAEFRIDVENDFTEQRTFRISSISSPPPTNSWFGYDNSQSVDPGENVSFSVAVTPPETAIQQNYMFEVNLRTISGDNHERVSEYFTVSHGADLKVLSSGLNRNSFRPGEQVETNLTVFNTAPSSLNYQVRASLLGDSSTQAAGIASGTRRTHSFNLQVPDDAAPGEYNLQLEVLRGDTTEQVLNQSLGVVPVRHIDRSTESQNRVIEYSETISATNTGNSVTRVELNKTLPGYIEPLTSFNTSADKASSSENGEIFHWYFELEPGETASVSYRTRYWPPILVAGILVAGLLALKRLYTGIGFSKKVRKDNGLVKVHIEVRNGSNHSIQNLEVTDFVPDIASVEDDFPMAEPVIRKTGNGTRLTWEIDSMEPGEQRVFEYGIKPLVEVEGGASLPKAELEVEGQRVKTTDKQDVEFKPE